MQPVTLGAALYGSLAAAPDRVRLIAGGQSLTGQALLAAIAGRQASARQAGIGHGNRVFLPSGRGAAYWIDLLALWGLGAVPVPVEAGAPAERLDGLRTRCGARPAMPDGDAGDAAAAPICAAAPDDEAAILFTSGSTGEPKGVRLTHRALLGNAQATRAVLEMHPDDHLFVAIPAHFTSTLSHVTVALLAGATVEVTEEKFLPADFLRRLAASGATAYGGSPLQLRWIADAAALLRFGLRWLMSSGDHLPADTIVRLRRDLPACAVFAVYGLTELGGRFCILPPDLADSRAGSVGRPIPGLAVRICDPSGAELPTGEIGEVVASGQWLMEDYVNDPERTAKRLGHGRLRTGDLGRLDDDGLLWLVGRDDDVFKRAGQKISVIPIVQELIRTGAFGDVAVVPQEDPQVGTVPVVLYVAGPTPFARGEIMRILRDRLPANHLPARFVPVAAIPRTGSGKLDRKAAALLLASEAPSPHT